MNAKMLVSKLQFDLTRFRGSSYCGDIDLYFLDQETGERVYSGKIKVKPKEFENWYCSGASGVDDIYEIMMIHKNTLILVFCDGFFNEIILDLDEYKPEYKFVMTGEYVPSETDPQKKKFVVTMEELGD
jgi:hypothetical protein